MSEPAIRLGQSGRLVEAMVEFEERYGGLSYSIDGGNSMDYGLEGDPVARPTPFGPAFGGIVDGHWTWGLDVLVDGRTVMGPGRWPDRVIDRSITQRLERHALLAEVRGWFHRTFDCFTPSDVGLNADEDLLPPPVPEADGPAEQWWSDDGVAVQATLRGWPPGRDRWTVRYFAREPRQTLAAGPTIYAALRYETVPSFWCALCCRSVAPDESCTAT